MWKNTVVLWMGEFGRTPRINQNTGRDHWARCWSVVLGGGAIQGGQVYGTTSDDGRMSRRTRQLGDLFATVYKGLGLDPTTQIRDNLGRPCPSPTANHSKASCDRSPSMKRKRPVSLSGEAGRFFAAVYHPRTRAIAHSYSRSIRPRRRLPREIARHALDLDGAPARPGRCGR